MTTRDRVCRWLTLRHLLTVVAALLLVLLVADSADAQRRRRRRRRAQPTEQTAPPSPDAGVSEATPASPYDGEPAPPGQAIEPVPATDDDPSSAGASDAGTPGVDPSGAGAPRAGSLASEPSSAPTADYDPGPAPPDITPIRSDYLALMDDLVQARMRVSTLGAELFRTRISVSLQDRTGENTTLARLVVHLDGAPVFQSEGPVEGGGEGREIFTGALAPGPHVLTLEAEQRSREDDAYRYTLRESFRFQVVRERLSEVSLVLEDSSDMARSFPSGGEGRYEVRTRLRVATRALAGD